MNANKNDYFGKETEFSEFLASNLHLKSIKRRIIHTKHQPQKTKNKGIPDIECILNVDSKPIRLEYQKLSNPFYIECKMSPLDIIHNLQQIIRYKYKIESHKHKKLSKIGDYNVVVTCPQFLQKDFSPRDFNSGWINPAQLIRTLWHLGIGVMYTDNKGRYKITFNEKEVLLIE